MPSQNLGDLIRNTKAQDFSPVPVGNYDVTVESAEYKPSSNGNPMWKVVFVIDEGQPSEGRKLFTQITVTEKSAPMAVAQMQTLGVEQETLAEALDPQGDPSVVSAQLVDAQAVAKVKHGEYEGRTTSNVDRILPRAGAQSSAAAARPASGARPSRPF